MTERTTPEMLSAIFLTFLNIFTRNRDQSIRTTIYLTQKVKSLNSDKDMNIEYNDVKNIAAAEFAISRDIAMIDIQMNPQRND